MPVEPRHACDFGERIEAEIAVYMVVDMGEHSQEPRFVLSLFSMVRHVGFQWCRRRR